MPFPKKIHLRKTRSDTASDAGKNEDTRSTEETMSSSQSSDQRSSRPAKQSGHGSRPMGKIPPPPKPSNRGNKELPLRNDPLQTDYVLGDEDIVFMPVMTLRRIHVEFSHYQDLVEQAFLSLTTQSSHWSKMVLPSAFSLYANWHLYWRLIQIKKATGDTLDPDEDTFDSAFKDDGSLLPEPLVTYLKGIGHFKVKDRESYFPIPVSMRFNEQGHFGQMNAQNAISYASIATPAMCLQRLVSEANQVLGNAFQARWDFPPLIRPANLQDVPATPTPNCIGYRPLRRSRPEACGHWANIINGAQQFQEVASQTKFLYVPGIAADMKNHLGITYGPNINPQVLTSDGSITQGITLIPARAIVPINQAQNWSDQDFYLRSAESLPREMASAGFLFGYRKVRTIANHQRISPALWLGAQGLDQGVPEHWMENANNYLHEAHPGSRNQDMFRTQQLNPLRFIQQWVSNHLQHKR